MRRIRTITLAALLLLATIGAAAPATTLATAGTLAPLDNCLANPSACV